MTQEQGDAHQETAERKGTAHEAAGEAMGDADERERGALQEARHDVEQDVVGGTDDAEG